MARTHRSIVQRAQRVMEKRFEDEDWFFPKDPAPMAAGNGEGYWVAAFIFVPIPRKKKS